MSNKKQKNIAIIDYGVGNLHSLCKAFEHLGANVFITEDADKILSADAVVLPGVGAFKSGMEGLEVRGLIKTVKNFADTGKPMLGICLGAQLMLSRGYEFGEFTGLGIIPGKVIHFPKLSKARVPHIGWNEIYCERAKGKEQRAKVSRWENTILDSIKEHSDVYFVHSYVLQPDKKEDILSMTEYGNHKFCSTVKKDRVYGCQFHPEKSGEVGLKIIENFIKII